MRALDFVDNAVSAEETEVARELGHELPALGGIGGQRAAERGGDVAAAEAVGDELAAPDGAQQGEVRIGAGLESPYSAAADLSRIVHLGDDVADGTVGVDGGESVQVASVGLIGDQDPSLDVSDAFAKGAHLALAVRVTFRASAALELLRAVGGGLDTEDRSLLVVHLDRVAAGGVPHADA